jgi:hypothetical protein
MRTHVLAPILLALLVSCGDSPGGADPDAAAASDAGPPDAALQPCAVCPRLVVADATGGVGIWDLAGALTDRAPDAVLAGIDGAPRGLAVHADRLIVISDGAERPVALFDGARALATGAAPGVQLTAAQVGTSGLDAVHAAHVDAGGNLWLLEGFGRVVLVKDAAGGAPTGSAQFTHPWMQLASMTVAGGKLFAGQISGGGILVWNDPLSRSGVVDGADWSLADVAAWALTAGGDRLFALGTGPQTRLAVWDGVGALASPHGPDVELAISPAQAVGDLQWRDNALVAVVANGVTENRVAIFADSTAVSPTSVPDGEVTPAAADYLQKSYLDSRGNLYVLDVDGIYIYRDALGAPALVTKLTTFGAPVDFAVVE